MRLGEYFTYEGEPYRNTAAHYEHQLAKLDVTIADAVTANEKKALRDRKALLTARYEAKSDDAIASKTWAEWKSSKWKLGEDIRKLTSLAKTRRNCFLLFGLICQKYRFRRSRST